MAVLQQASYRNGMRRHETSGLARPCHPRTQATRTRAGPARQTSTDRKQPEEMMVADLTSVDNPEVAPQRIAVPPRDPLASTSREPSPGPPQPPGSPLGKSFPGMSEHAQKILDRLAGAAAQYNGTNGNGANASAGLLDPRTSPALGKNSGLALMEDRLRQQALELRQAKLQLAERDTEVAALKAEAAEREARLRSSRAEIMEARASAQDKELKLREVYQQLAEAGAERARLRDELTRTRMELADTQADLEALADEILSIKDLVLSEGELEELDTVLNAEQSSDEEALPEGSVAGSKQGGQGTEPTPSPASIAPSRASQGVAAGASGVDAASELASVASIAAQGTWDMLQSLAEFSRQVLEDAQQDEAAFTGSGILKGLPGFPGSFSGGKSTSQRPGNAQDEVCGDRDRP